MTYFLYCEHREKEFKEFTEKQNEKYPTIKFTAEWSQTSINFLDVALSFIGKKVTTDLYVKPTYSHQHLHSSSCHPYHFKKRIPYSQTLCLNPIQDGPSWGCSQMKEGQKVPLPKNLSHIIYSDVTWHRYTLPKEDPKKYMNHVTHPLISADINIFHQRSAAFVVSRNTDINCILIHNF